MSEKITKVLVGIASYMTQYVESLHSCISQIHRDEDNIMVSYDRRGDIARQAFADMIIDDPNYAPDDALLLLDADQRHPLDMLERLRVHNLDMVCAHYYARNSGAVQSMCFVLGDPPYLPYKNPPRGGLHEIATTGFGCVLIKKKVLQAMRLNTEEGRNMMETDFMFFHNARQLGFKLYLDASLNSDHGVVVWLDHDTARRLREE